MTDAIRIQALTGIPGIEPGDDLAELLLPQLRKHAIADNDILIIAQKIVSKAEDRYVDLADITPSHRAEQLAGQVDKDPRLVELILSQSRRVVRYRKDVLIVEHKLGFVHANAGIDHSNIPQNDQSDRVLLLPEEPDTSARKIHLAIKKTLDIHVGVLINDSVGRAWRNGVVGIAIGAAGLPCIVDLRGEKDMYDNTLIATEAGIADELASAASLVMGQSAQGIPAVLIRGVELNGPMQNSTALIRAAEKDLFR